MNPRTFTVAAPDGALLRVQEYAAPSPLGAPTVLLAHGWTLTHASWLPVVEQLVAGGSRVVTYDQRGHGASSALRGRPTVRALGDDLAVVFDVVAPQGKVVLGGHSMGGMAVMAFAGLHPKAFEDRVAGVVLMSTSAGDLRQGRPTIESRAMWLASRLPRIAAGRLITERGQQRLLFGADADPEHVRLTRAQVAATTLPTMGRFFGALGDHDEAEALARFAGVPTVVVVGDRDKLTPLSHSERLAALVPHAELRVLAGRGHMLSYEATDDVVAAFDSVLETARPTR